MSHSILLNSFIRFSLFTRTVWKTNIPIDTEGEKTATSRTISILHSCSQLVHMSPQQTIQLQPADVYDAIMKHVLTHNCWEESLVSFSLTWWCKWYDDENTVRYTTQTILFFHVSSSFEWPWHEYRPLSQSGWHSLQSQVPPWWRKEGWNQSSGLCVVYWTTCLQVSIIWTPWQMYNFKGAEKYGCWRVQQQWL